MTLCSGAPSRADRPGLTVVIDDPDSDCGRLRYSVDKVTTAMTRIRRPELRTGIRERVRLRDEWVRAGKDPSDLSVALEIDVLVAETTGTARAELLRLGQSMGGDTVRYVGTAPGLASLILDVYVAEVADAVVLCPIDCAAGEVSSSSTLIEYSVLPIVAERARHI